MMRVEPPTCERPLVVRCGALGDMVLITALIDALHARFRSVVDVLTTGPWSAPLLLGQPGVGEVWCVRSRKTPYWLSRDQQRVVGFLTARGAGPTWMCDANQAARPMLTRAGVTDAWIVNVRDHPLLPGEHATQQWRRLAGINPVGIQSPVPAPTTTGIQAGGCRLEVSDTQRADLLQFLRDRGMSDAPVIAIQVGNKRTMRRGLRRLAANNKYWPNERWALVLRHLRQRHPAHAILLLGAGPEYQLNAELATLTGIERLYNVANGLTVPRLAALLAHADALVTVDSGPAHVGAAVGCPQVVLFGKALPTLYRPWGTSGADVKVLTGRLGGEASMLGIEPDAVLTACDALRFRNGRGAGNALGAGN